MTDSNRPNTCHVSKKKRGLCVPFSYLTESVIVVSTFVVSTLVVSVTTAVESVAVDSVDVPDPQDASVNEDKIASVIKILFIPTKVVNEINNVKRVSKKS